MVITQTIYIIDFWNEGTEYWLLIVRLTLQIFFQVIILWSLSKRVAVSIFYEVANLIFTMINPHCELLLFMRYDNESECVVTTCALHLGLKILVVRFNLTGPKPWLYLQEAWTRAAPVKVSVLTISFENYSPFLKLGHAILSWQ